MFEKSEGTLQQIAGRAQDTYGAATGNIGAQIEGKARQVAGHVQQNYGGALNQVRESAFAHPLGTLAAIAGVGFILGALWAKR